MPESPNNSLRQDPEPLPEVIAHYRILQRLGKGGMDEVFLAEDERFKQLVKRFDPIP